MTQQVEGKCLKDPSLPCPNRQCANAPDARAIESFPPNLQDTYRRVLTKGGTPKPCYQQQQGKIK